MIAIQRLLLGVALALPVPKDTGPDDKNQGYFGIQLIDDGGVKVTFVQPGSPAETGGLKMDDLVLKIDDQRIPNVNECREIISKLKPGRIVRVDVRRGDTSMALKVKIGVRPAQP
jgi:S1-C subfamily serine protease